MTKTFKSQPCFFHFCPDVSRLKWQFIALNAFVSLNFPFDNLNWNLLINIQREFRFQRFNIVFRNGQKSLHTDYQICIAHTDTHCTFYQFKSFDERESIYTVHLVSLLEEWSNRFCLHNKVNLQQNYQVAAICFFLRLNERKEMFRLHAGAFVRI